MKKQALLLLLILLCSVAAQAQKLYKIQDKDGNVSFSQFPPTEQEEAVTVENLTVASSPQSIVTEKLDGFYCGEIKLPRPPSSGSDSTSYTKTLDSTRASWREQLEDVSRRVDQENQRAIDSGKSRPYGYNRYSNDYRNKKSKQYRLSIDEHAERLRDLRCAVNWADREFRGREEVVVEISTERQRLETIRRELELTLASRCGDLVPYDPRDERNEALRKQWYDCSADLQREINQINQQLNQI